jgi:hypothetical protein
MRISAACLLVAAGLGLLSSGREAAGGEVRLAHAVVVLVNGQAITAAEIDDAARFILRSRHYQQSGQAPDVEAVLQQLDPEQLEQVYTLARNELIKVTLIHQGADALGLTVPWESVSRGLRASGYDAPMLAPPIARRFIESELLFDRVLMEEGRPPYNPSPRAVLEFYSRNRDGALAEQREVRVRHIFLDVYGRDPWEVKERAQEMRAELMATPVEARAALFREYATEYSEGRFARQEGLLRIGTDEDGWFMQDFPNTRPDGSPAFPEPMYLGIRALLREGEVSPVIRSDMGYHLLYLEEVRGGEAPEFRDVQEVIRKLLENRARRERKREWLENAVRAGNITWHDGSAYPIEELDPPAADEPVL